MLDLESRSAKNVTDATSVHGAVAVNGALEPSRSSIKVATVGPVGVEPPQLEGLLSPLGHYKDSAKWPLRRLPAVEAVKLQGTS